MHAPIITFPTSAGIPRADQSLLRSKICAGTSIFAAAKHSATAISAVVYMYIHVYIYVRMCMCIDVYTYIYMYIYVCMCLCIYVCVYIYMYVCIDVFRYRQSKTCAGTSNSDAAKQSTKRLLRLVGSLKT